MMIPIAVLPDRPWTMAQPGWMTTHTVVGRALLSTVFAYINYLRIVATARTTNLTLVTFLILVSAVLLGVSVLGERLASEHFISMELIAGRFEVIDGRALRVLRVD